MRWWPRLALLLLAPLLLLLLGALLVTQTAGPGRAPAENPPLQVNGKLGGSALFPLKLPPTTKTVARIEWFFQAGSSPEILIATFKDGELEGRNPSDQFGQRLEMADKATLRIRALEKEDRGVLMASVLFATYEIHKQTFHLAVFEPLPDPQIQAQLVSKTAEGCNMTLQCPVSERGAFNISWERGNRLRALEEESEWNQLSAEGTELHLSWRPDSTDSTFTCLLSNPVDQKNVSFDLLSICQSEGHPRKLWLLLLTVLFPCFLAASLGVYLCKKKSCQGADLQTVPEEEGSSSEPQYAELQKRRSPPEGDENQDPDPLPLCRAEIPPGTIPATIYTTLQPPSAS